MEEAARCPVSQAPGSGLVCGGQCHLPQLERRQVVLRLPRAHRAEGPRGAAGPFVGLRDLRFRGAPPRR
eukprot:7893341-Lingulodinium_polyedra.AAC.1